MSPANQMAPTKTAASTAQPVRAEDPRHSSHRWLLLAGVGLVLTMVIRGFVVQSYYIPTGSMEPTLERNDRILVSKIATSSVLQRGDLVVFDGTDTFAPHAAAGPIQESATGRALDSMASMLSIQTSQSDYVKRVVGLPGDHVVCCDANGLIVVNDVSVIESYVYPGDKPSDLSFDVTVPSERIWLMGDHRSDSSDSRAHLGDPGGGMVRLDDVIGRAAMVYWPPSRASVLHAPASLAGIPGRSVGVGPR